PPYIFLPLGPGTSFRIGGGAIVENAAIVRPDESPFRIHIISRRAFARARAIFSRFREDTAVDPAAAGGAAIIFQFRKTGHMLSVRHRVAVYFLQDFFRVGLACNAAGRAVWQDLGMVELIIPGEVEQALVAGRGGSGIKRLQP